jgi:DNA/RNA endonuclease YhcR with UshA esterase domain
MTKATIYRITRALMVPIVLTSLSALAMDDRQNKPDQEQQKTELPKYNKENETTIKGTVDSVAAVPTDEGEFMTVALKNGEGMLKKVYLAPAEFLSEKNFQIAQGEALQVTGAKVKQNGSELILAREVKQGTTSLSLRNEKGRPEWGGIFKNMKRK